MSTAAREIDEGGNHTRWAAATGKRRSAVPRHREIDYRLRPIDLQAARSAAADGSAVVETVSRTVSPTRKIYPTEPDPTGCTKANQSQKPLQIRRS